MGIDLGAARVGVARGSSIARLAEPLTTLPANQAMTKLAELARQHQADGIVAGLPRNLNGEDTAQTKVVRDWIAAAKACISLPFYWQDEALTSKKATGYRLSTKSSHDEHALAAAIILQDFLNTSETDRVAA